MSLTTSLFLFLWQRRWLPHFISRRVYKQLIKRNAAPAFNYQKQFYNLQYAGNFDNNIDIDIYYFDAFEKPILFFMRDYLLGLANSTKHVVDIGANIGQHTLFLSQYADRVDAFEPYAKVSARLQQQLTLNNIAHVYLHKVGLGATNTELPFYAPTGRNMGIGSFDSSVQSKGNAAIGKLQVVRGDDYFASHHINRIALMKIDVEGLEKAVLEGLTQVLQQERPLVLFEITHSTDTAAFRSLAELHAAFPVDYHFFMFNKRKQDGSKHRRNEAKHRSSGEYHIVPFTFQFPFGQDDVIACPAEQLAKLPKLAITATRP